MTAARPRVLVCGDVINDILAQTPGALSYGADNPAAIRTRPGGSAANQAAWMAKLGLDVVFAGRVGAQDADFHRQELARFGVEPRLTADESVATGSIIVLIGPDGERTMITDRGANLRLRPADVPATLLDGAALLHLTGYSFFAPGPREAALGLIAQARSRGVPVTIDPGSAAFLAMLEPGAFLAWTHGAAVCFPNRDEAAVLTETSGQTPPLTETSGQAPVLTETSGQAPPLTETSGQAPLLTETSGQAPVLTETSGQAPVLAGTSGHAPVAGGPVAAGGRADPAVLAGILAKHYGAVALKLGAEGALLAAADAAPVRIAARPVTVRDTTGAGDAFCAGFLAAWLTGSGMIVAAQAGAAAAAVAVSNLGGRPD